MPQARASRDRETTMAFKIPTLPELVQQARQAFRTYLPGSDAWIWPNNLNVAAKVKAALIHGTYLWLKYIEKQAFVTTADGAFIDRHGAQYAINRLPPSYARGRVEFSGRPNAAIPAGLGVERSDGVGYEVTASATVAGGGTVTLDVRALVAGKEGNALAGTPVTLILGEYGSRILGRCRGRRHRPRRR